MNNATECTCHGDPLRLAVGADVICPRDWKACLDDLCHGSGCMQMDGYPMLSICPVCKGAVDEEISECGSCTCDDEGWDET